MNILYHHRTQGTGAEGVHIGYVIKGFRQLGHHVDIVSPNDLDPVKTAGGNPYAAKKSFKAKFLASLSWILPNSLFAVLEILYNFAAYFKLKRIFDEKPIQFLYERNAFFLWVGADMAQKHGVYYIVEVNEIAGEERIRRQAFVGFAKRIERYVFRRANAIVVVSQFLKDKIEDLGVEGYKIHVIPNAVDEKLFDPAIQNGNLRKNFRFAADTVVLGFIGWFVSWHNLEGLIDVFSQIAEDQDVRLFLVGDGVLKEKLKELAKDKGVEDKVIFSGAIEYKQIPEYVNAMDICIIPGSNEYRSPIKLFEYMAMKKAVVAPRLKPIQQVVQEDKDGVLFDQTDPATLRSVLLRLIDDSQLRRVLGENARHKILNKHTWLLNAKEIVGLVTIS